MIVVGMRVDESVLTVFAKLSLYGARPSCVTVCYRSSKYLLHYVIASVNALWVRLSVHYAVMLMRAQL